MHLELWGLGALGTFQVGLSKTGIAGLGKLNVAIFALMMPARQSVGRCSGYPAMHAVISWQ